MAFLANLLGYVLNYLYNWVQNYGWAIIIFSVLLKLILLPFTIKQQKACNEASPVVIFQIGKRKRQNCQSNDRGC